uniref:Uncharacterized protein n=1 Tax=Siphoviridae sp. ctCb814 TaxID=2827808 RepID=A0A8S5SN79_9CAUD|nr:MAG TPA: hypothetical protein [Siphoviridae sp. ctCb814]
MFLLCHCLPPIFYLIGCIIIITYNPKKFNKNPKKLNLCLTILYFRIIIKSQTNERGETK